MRINFARNYNLNYSNIKVTFLYIHNCLEVFLFKDNLFVFWFFGVSCIKVSSAKLNIV